MIPWIGGKQALCRAIISRFPADVRQRTYVEVFGGGASVLLNKERSVKEIYNDFNSNLVNLFRMVRDQPKELQAALRYILNAREDFDTVKARFARGHNKDPVLWARDFYQLIRQSYGGGGTSFGPSPRSTWAAFPLIDAVAERFQYVVVEHMSYERLIRISEGAIFYLDPPYVLTEDYYGNLFGPKDHLLLTETLFGAKALWLLSYNDCDAIRALYSVPGIYIEKIERLNNMAQRYDPGNMYQELLISNYDTLLNSSDCAIVPAGSWENEESDSRSSSAIGNLIQQTLTRTASDRFFITAKEEDGYFALLYHPADKPDSQKMQEIKAALNLTRPVQYDRGLFYEGAGWAGPMRWEQYSGAQGIAEKIEYYLLELHPYTDRYYLTEPEPGKFYN